MYILGINAYHGDAAAALVEDGKLVAAVEEERFNRIKHCAGFPTRSIEYCLEAAGIAIEDVEHVGISRNPSANLHKKILAVAKRAAAPGQWSVMSSRRAEASARAGSLNDESTLSTHASAGANGNGNGNGQGHLSSLAYQVRGRLRNVARVRDLRSELAGTLGVSKQKIRAHFHHIEHHRAHLASSFFVSPFDRAALLSLDGFGDFVSTMWAIGEGNSIKVLGQVGYPHSLGLLYTATTQFLGFPHYGDEGKVMGLAPYGKPIFIDQFRELIRTEANGRFSLNLDYFRHATEGVEMTWDKGSPEIGKLFSNEFERAFGPPRKPDSQLTDRESDLAASLQLRLEEVAFHILNHLHEQTGVTDLGLSGGVAYNSVMNGRILRETPFTRIFIQPAAGDSGTAVGVCYQIWSDVSSLEKTARYPMTPYTGPEYSDDEIESELRSFSLGFKKLSDHELVKAAARDVAGGLVVGWFQGRMEFGPRALGNRSILADPRRAEMKNVLNDRIKKREAFRPFAPSILEEHTAEYFLQDHPSPDMLMVYAVNPDRRREVPAVTHVDGSGRLQTVSRETNPRYYDLITEFHKITGVPLVLNTSFNENEPIVCTPREAIDCFLKTRIDVLYLNSFVVRRPETI